jgi:hypothetical protein
VKRWVVLGVIVVLAVLSGAIASGALKFGSGATTKAADGARVYVSRDFGARRVDEAKLRKVPAGDTVMRLLQREFEVTTRYGGGFVQSIEGLAGGTDGRRRSDWFYYVNGIEASDGAAAHKVAGGDRIWWDHHDWDAAQRIPAVVGSYPEPFVSGSEGRQIPLSLVCAGEERSCEEVSTRLGEAGVKGIARTGIGAGFGRKLLRIIVGPWKQIRSDPAVAQLARGPGGSGVYARPRGDGLQLLDAEGRVTRTLTQAGGLVAATRFQDQEPTWIVTGTDDAGVAAAAASLREDLLRNRFAVAVEDGRDVPLPVRLAR